MPSSAVGGLRVGQEVRIHLRSNPPKRYAIQYGKIQSISETSIDVPLVNTEVAHRVRSSFEVTVHFPHGLDMGPDEREGIRPGMVVEADLVLDHGTLSSWIWSPLRRAAARL